MNYLLNPLRNLSLIGHFLNLLEMQTVLLVEESQTNYTTYPIIPIQINYLHSITEVLENPHSYLAMLFGSNSAALWKHTKHLIL